MEALLKVDIATGYKLIVKLIKNENTTKVNKSFKKKKRKIITRQSKITKPKRIEHWHFILFL